MLTQRELGQRLKSARETIGLTQQQVADHVELTRVAISQIESGTGRSIHLNSCVYRVFMDEIWPVS